jgi:hypothetical protein
MSLPGENQPSEYLGPPPGATYYATISLAGEKRQHEDDGQCDDSDEVSRR